MEPGVKGHQSQKFTELHKSMLLTDLNLLAQPDLLLPKEGDREMPLRIVLESNAWEMNTGGLKKVTTL